VTGLGEAMAAFDATLTWWGVDVELAHHEVDALLSTTDIRSELVSIAGGSPRPPFDAALDVAALHVAARPASIKELDQGNGITLTIPWTAVWWGHWWLVAPNTR
jgi:hypothetical protein